MKQHDRYIEGPNVTPVIKALSNDMRLKILNLLSDSDMNVQSIASHLNISKTAALTHINLLEEAGFIQSRYLSGSVGNQRICHKKYDRLIFNFNPELSEQDDRTYYESEVPVGNYFDFDAWAPCGLATHNNIINRWDNPTVFCDPKRVTAALVWTAFGYIEYKIPVEGLFFGKKVTEVSMEMEVGAHIPLAEHDALRIPPEQDPGRITDGFSDITVWINGQEIGTSTYGVGTDREKGIYTPTWWRSTPQHGFPLKISVGKDGCQINGRPVTDRTFAELVGDAHFFRLRLGIKPNAEHSSGLMIFGREFGKNYHDIVVHSFIE